MILVLAITIVHSGENQNPCLQAETMQNLREAMQNLRVNPPPSDETNMILLGDSILDDNATLQLFKEEFPTRNFSMGGAVTTQVPNQIAQAMDNINQNTIVVLSVGGNNIGRGLIQLGPQLLQIAPQLIGMPQQQPIGNMDGKFISIETSLAGLLADVREEVANLLFSIPTNRIILLTFPIPQLLQTMLIPAFQSMEQQGQIKENPFTREKISEMILNTYRGHATGSGAPVEVVHLSSELTPEMFRDMVHPNDQGREMIFDLVAAKMVEKDWC